MLCIIINTKITSLIDFSTKDIVKYTTNITIWHATINDVIWDATECATQSSINNFLRDI